jgi:putative heme-binding domain-containing protein
MKLARLYVFIILLAGLLAAGASRASAQHEVTSDDIREGERLFVASCTGCHGPDGDAVFGVDLKRSQFRRATTDDDLVRAIREGVPNTAMPPNNLSEPQARMVVAYMRSFVSTPLTLVPGDAARGRSLFEGKGKCTACHRVNGAGSRVGPDLSEVGQQRRVADLERALLDPSGEVLPANRSFRVVTRDGATILGRLLNHDTFMVLVIDTQERLHSFVKTDLREFGFVAASPMPSYRDALTAEERTDVIRYLATLRGVKAATVPRP